MSFDKTKTMRNAERFLSQGKIRAAISEYKRIVENDPKDFSTLNILGDLHIKSSESKEAVQCYTQVAEHYGKQGFAQKAIAIYNKIARIHPNSIEVSEKLAQLYQAKGSVAEARAHYTTIAENYQRKGQKIEALSVWKQIAQLDPNNTDIYLKIADVCWQEEQFDEAAESFTEAGLRFLKQSKYEAALSAFTKSLEVKKNYLRALNGLVKAQIGLGFADDAAQTLENILAEQPFNRDILYLLVDCYIDMNNPAEAEKTVVKLVEQEPANYPKFLELVKIYIKNNDLDSAARILSISSEHLLVGGQAQDFLTWTNEILAQNPEHINALRLLARYYGWQRDEAQLKQSLERLAEVGRTNESVEDERYALSQLVMISPHDRNYAQRLQELNGSQEFENVDVVDENEFAVKENTSEIPEFENFAVDNDVDVESKDASYAYSEFDFADNADSFAYEAKDLIQDDSPDNVKEFDFYAGSIQPDAAENSVQTEEFSTFESSAEITNGDGNLADEIKLQKEIESVDFYIAQGYKDLADKSLTSLEAEFGNREEIERLRLQMNETFQSSIENLPAREAENEDAKDAPNAKVFETLDELKDEFDLTENESTGDDYDTYYQMAIAYKEMGLMEDSIREFQNALGLIKIDDGTRRFFQCANLLGHCFMEKQMPNLALMWFKRGLETPDLNTEEIQALYYEIADAYESGGDLEKSVEYFEKLYAEDVDYRNVSQRLDALRESNQVA
ncbi:MAG TPA: tetratricopeptide repeat protein [Pyrinomonadaceae bacterium]|nr:tetratricopeptide repeat protein [Pyrinomonadaceae bacterium]